MSDSTEKIVKNSLRELKLSSLAAVIVLGISLLIYIFIPTVRAYLSEKDSELMHERIYQSLPAGGEIVYRFKENNTDSTKLENLKKDLEILSRRFQRGNFELLSIPGSADTEEVKSMNQYKNQFSYTVNLDGNSATLQIHAAHPAAKKALDKYLNFLQKSWNPEK